jgi:transcriptional regulator with XRE-family HTH domain
LSRKKCIKSEAYGKIFNVSKVGHMVKYLQVGERLRQLRGDLSQEEFAQKIGVPIKSYQRYEYGQYVPRPHTLTKIAEMCDTTTDWILTGNLNIDKARMMERLKTAYELEDIVEKLEQIRTREEKLLVFGVKERAAEYGLEHLEEKDFIEKLRSYIADVKIDFLPPKERKLVDALLEILNSGDEGIIEAIEANLREFLKLARLSKSDNENKGGD